MIYVYTTGDGVPYSAADGTLLAVGTPSNITDYLITDRTLVDVSSLSDLLTRAKVGNVTDAERTLLLDPNHKGAYNYTDLNRVEEAVAYVAGRLNEFGYISVLPVTRFWSVEDIPTENDLLRYFNNVATLRGAIAVWASTPTAPHGVEGFGVNEANALEQILVDVNLVLTRISQAWFYSGDFYSAEV